MRKSIHTDAQNYLRSLLVRARRNAELTQQELAERVGRPQSFISKYESGERRLDVIEFIDIARAIDADPIALLRQLIKAQKL